jgi:hypothetical protein
VVASSWQVEGTDLVTPQGLRVPLKTIQHWLTEARNGNQQILTPKWSGWRICQQYLVPPGRGAQKAGVPMLAIRHLALELEARRRR